MKYIPLRTLEGFTTKEILHSVASNTKKGINLDEMRLRCRVLAAIEKAETHVLLEDADFNLMKRLIPEFPFAFAHPSLLALVDEILNAKEPPAAVQKPTRPSSANGATKGSAETSQPRA